MAAMYLGADARVAFVGKARDWYYVSNGGVALSTDYPSAVLGLADQLSDAVVDSLLGDRGYWPHRPADDHLLTAVTDVAGRCWWACMTARHIVAEVGELPRLEVNR